MKAVLDAGALIAVDRADRRVGAMLRILQQARVPLRTSAAVVAQVWRDGRKQARLARLLAAVARTPLAPDDDLRTGELLRMARTDDVVDGHLALAVEPEDRILTSDPDDLRHLLATRGIAATVVDV